MFSAGRVSADDTCAGNACAGNACAGTGGTLGRCNAWAGAGRSSAGVAVSIGGRGSGMALLRQSGEPCEIAADAEAPIAAENPLAVEHRQARKLDRKPLLAVVDRPDDGEPAPGVAGGDGARDLTLGVEVELGGHLPPGPPDRGGGPRTDQSDEFVGAEREAAVFIHLPDEAQRMAPFGRGRYFRRGGRRRCERGHFGCGRGDRLGPRLRQGFRRRVASTATCDAAAPSAADACSSAGGGSKSAISTIVVSPPIRSMATGRHPHSRWHGRSRAHRRQAFARRARRAPSRRAGAVCALVGGGKELAVRP